jgi:hypothetical protein
MPFEESTMCGPFVLLLLVQRDGMVGSNFGFFVPGQW